MTGMKANPGGNISAAYAVGRDQLCRACWNALEVQSIRLENERRLGKTTLVRKMVAMAPERTHTVVMEVGGLSSTVGFIEELIDRIDAVIPEKGKSFKTRARDVISAIAGVEIAGVVKIPDLAKPYWRKILLGCFQELMKATQDRVVLFWDEIPWMLQKIKAAEGNGAAIDLMDTLRDIRQTHERVRMVYTGSIGFHHVLAQLEEDGIPGRPLNDMRRINVPPLDRTDALFLALNLLQGEGLKVADPEATAEALYDNTGGIAFYIHCVVADLIPGGEASPEKVAQRVAAALRSPSDPWEMRHFDTRLKAYYGTFERRARSLLDAIAEAEEPCPFGVLLERLQGVAGEAAITIDQDEVASLLRRLMLDHYLVAAETTPRRYEFRFPLLRRWWRISRRIDL
jgi:hypothetical protein